MTSDRPPFNLELVDAATRAALAEGKHRILQTHRYAPTDEGHVDVLLRLFQPLPPAPVILDAGCGLGEVSRLMAQRLPDAAFVLANVSALQLQHCPTGRQFVPLLTDCHALPLPAQSVDAVMFSSALCQMDAPVALREAARVLRPGGVLLVNEMVHFGGGNDLIERVLAGRVPIARDLLRTIAQAGFEDWCETYPEADDSHFRELLRAAGLEAGLDDVKACVMRAQRAA